MRIFKLVHTFLTLIKINCLKPVYTLLFQRIIYLETFLNNKYLLLLLRENFPFSFQHPQFFKMAPQWLITLSDIAPALKISHIQHYLEKKQICS
jgi:hypothetical protein